MYYDVVISIYEDENCNVRTYSDLLCGGFETKDKAITKAKKYIDNNEVDEHEYLCSDKEYPCIEIEEHNEDGSFECLISID